MKTKIFTITKTGYTTGIYGCTGEYFTLNYTYINKTTGDLEMNFFHFQGMYWADERVREAMENKKFRYQYSNANYGKLVKKDIYPNTMDEYEAIEYIKNNFKHKDD